MILSRALKRLTNITERTPYELVEWEHVLTINGEDGWGLVKIKDEDQF
ncbi:MAG: hypothetical protein ACI8T1_002725 [Verrucomicrobiales bacterium]|jgi:hypothetical protein